MTLDDVSVEPSVHHHATFEVHTVTFAQQSEVASPQGLLYGGDGVGAVAVDGYDREAHSVVGNRLVDFKFIGETRFYGEVHVASVAFYSDDSGGLLYDS